MHTGALCTGWICTAMAAMVLRRKSTTTVPAGDELPPSSSPPSLSSSSYPRRHRRHPSLRRQGGMSGSETLAGGFHRPRAEDDDACQDWQTYSSKAHPPVRLALLGFGAHRGLGRAGRAGLRPCPARAFGIARRAPRRERAMYGKGGARGLAGHLWRAKGQERIGGGSRGREGTWERVA